MAEPRYVNDISEIKEMEPKDFKDINEVLEKFEFKSNDYYLSLINWDDSNDPIKRIILPCREELKKWGELDVSNEKKYSIISGLQHKYRSTAVILASDSCGGYCRYCFRKRLFIHPEQKEVLRDYETAFKYIREHSEINNVLITGGDALMLSTERLENLISNLREIPNVKIIRIGTKLLSYDPYRVINDPSLLKMVKKYSLKDKRIYFMLHFSHPNEITDVSLKACDLLIKAGGILCNQTPLLRGINDQPKVLGELFNTLSYMGVPPYYVFLCRPTTGNLTYAIPVEEAFYVFQTARGMCSGLGKRAKLTMSHSDGKIEVVAMTEENTIFRIHRAADPDDSGKVFICKRNPSAYWFDDYEDIVDTISPIDLSY